MGAIPKPVDKRLAHGLKQDHNRGGVHGQQIIALQAALNALPVFPASGTGVTAPPASGGTYDPAWATAVTSALTALITSLADAGIIG